MNKKISGFVLKIALIVLLVFPTAAFAGLVQTSPKLLIVKVEKERYLDIPHDVPLGFAPFMEEPNPRRLTIIKDFSNPFSPFYGGELYIVDSSLVTGDMILLLSSEAYDEHGPVYPINPIFSINLYNLLILFLVIIVMMIIIYIKRKEINAYLDNLDNTNGTTQNPK